MAETSSENNAQSSNEGFKNKNFQGRNFGRNNNRFPHLRNQFNMGDPNQNENSGGGQKRPFLRPPFPDRIEQQIAMKCHPTLELPPINLSEKKFSGRNRLYIGNVDSDVTKEDLEKFFTPYGEVAEVFINKDKKFAFLKLDYHANAVKARKGLDGAVLKTKILRILISPSSAVVKVKNLVPTITSELLWYAFAPFGEIENAMVSVDERGRSIGEGIIDFTRKYSAAQAIEKCKEKCYFLSRSLRPVIVEPYEIIDQSVGLLDRHLLKRNDFVQERSFGPRIVEPGTFESEYGDRWKTIFENYKQKEEALRTEFRLECGELEAEMALAHHEHEAEVLRNQLRARGQDKERHQMAWEAKKRRFPPQFGGPFPVPNKMIRK